MKTSSIHIDGADCTVYHCDYIHGIEIDGYTPTINYCEFEVSDKYSNNCISFPETEVVLENREDAAIVRLITSHMDTDYKFYVYTNKTTVPDWCVEVANIHRLMGDF